MQITSVGTPNQTAHPSEIKWRSNPNAAEWAYKWKHRVQHAERYGTTCRILSSGAHSTLCCVEFEDGTQAVASRHYVKRSKP